MRELKECIVYNPDSGKLTRGDREVGTVGYNGYLKFTFFGVEYLSHRVCWFLHYGYWPNKTDHINHDRQDNRILNLRDVDSKENNKNQSLRHSNKLGVTGVYWCKTRCKFRSQIRVDGKKVNLGSFDNLFDAACCQFKARLDHGYHRNHGGSV